MKKSHVKHIKRKQAFIFIAHQISVLKTQDCEILTGRLAGGRTITMGQKSLSALQTWVQIKLK